MWFILFILFLFNWKNVLIWYYFKNVFPVILNMPINVFGNSSNNSDNKIDTSQFVQKPYLRANYVESNIEEDINMKNKFKNKN